MHAPTRRSVLTGAAVLGLGAIAPAAAGKPSDKGGGNGGDADGSLRMKVDDAVADSGRCHLPRDTATVVGLEDGHQVRLTTDDGPALFTVVVHDGKFGHVSPGGRDRLLAGKDSFSAIATTEVVHPTMDLTTARETGEYVERAVHGSTTTIAVAPHGGYIEYGTDEQATRFADRLGATAWYAAGWWPGGGAYRRWHVTSTRIHPASFPALNGLADTGFDTAVGFHGWGESHLGVGGAAPVDIREAVRDDLAAALGGAVEVRLATDPARDGSSPANVTNWLTASGRDGVQLEQPILVRREYGTLVADTVADTLSELA